MKILILIDDFLSSNGVARDNQRLAMEWIKKGHQVNILTFRYDNFTNLKVNKIRKFLFPNKKITSVLDKSIRIIKPDVIFSNVGRIGYAVSKKYNTICRYSGSFPYDLGYNFFDGPKIFLGSAVLQFIQILNMRNSQILISPSKFFAEKNKKFSKKSLYIYDSIQISNNKNILNLGEKSLLFIGEIRYSKGILFLLKSFKKIRVQHPNTKLYILGRPSNKFLLQKIKREDGVFYLGVVKDVTPFLSSCSIFVFPSYAENFSKVLLEAQSLGKPVITFKVGGLSQIVKDKKNGFLVKKNDMNTFIKKVSYLLNNPEVARKMGENGKRFIKRFNSENSAEMYLKVFRKFINDKINFNKSKKFLREK